MNDNWMKKVRSEQALSKEENASLDQALSNLEGIRTSVQSLSDETPSLEWRSKLNEALLAVAPAPKKVSWWKRSLIPATGLAAAVLGIAFMNYSGFGPKSQRVSDQDSIEEMMLVTHSSMEFASTTQTAGGASPVSSTKDDSAVQWTPEDLGSL